MCPQLFVIHTFRASLRNCLLSFLMLSIAKQAASAQGHWNWDSHSNYGFVALRKSKSGMRFPQQPNAACCFPIWKKQHCPKCGTTCHLPIRACSNRHSGDITASWQRTAAHLRSDSRLNTETGEAGIETPSFVGGPQLLFYIYIYIYNIYNIKI